MAEMRRRFPLDGIAKPGANPEGTTPTVTLTVRNAVAQALVMARRGRAEAVADALGVAASPGLATVTDRFVACPTAPGRWACLADGGDDGTFATTLRQAVADAGQVVDHSHGRQTVRVGGPEVREYLSRGCRLDLHRRVAGPGFCAETPVFGIGCLLVQLDDAPRFDLVVYAGYAEAFWHRLTAAAARFGYSVTIEHVGN